MEITMTKENDTLTVSPAGRLDTVTSEELRAAVTEAWNGECDLLLDFAEVEYISSAGLRLLVALKKKAMAGGRAMTLSHVNHVVGEVLKIAGLNKVLTIV